SRHFGGRPVGHSDRVRLVLVIFSLALLVVLGGSTVWLLSRAPEVAGPVKAVAVQPEPEVQMVDVLVPMREVNAGVKLEPAMFKKESRHQAGLDPRIVKDFEEIAGQYARTLLIPGQPLHHEQLTNVRPNTAISASIPVGFRAVAIRTNATSSVEGWAMAGSKVDVHWQSEIAGKAGLTTIVQNAKVLSAERMVSSNTPQNAPVPSTVTLLVTARDARKIALAQTTGSLVLSLRGDSDSGKSDSDIGSITVDDLLNRRREGEPNIPATKGTVVIGGEKWLVGTDGSLIPWPRRNNAEGDSSAPE
ncbi:MAG: Flp pilus assembly protein CpaB, partial [Deltaproteobacteria bacterium]|nr:Flp pilus assembly protein CpaB [Deltaproteobacteria bacterium]